MIDFVTLYNTINTQAIAWAPRLVAAALTLIIGWWVIGMIIFGINRAMKKSKIEETLRGFLKNIAKTTLRILLLITVVGMLGVQMTSFIAIIGAAGLAVGLALQGSLANFAGGVLILLLKPFKKGDFIQAQGESGVVQDIEIFHTTLKTGDNIVITIPNGSLANGNITNYSKEKTRRVQHIIGIGYEDDSDKAIQIIQKILDKHEKILAEPETFVRVSELADSSVNITVRAWTKSSDYWEVHFDTLEQIKHAFDKQGINIPYPQMDVHVKK